MQRHLEGLIKGIPYATSLTHGSHLRNTKLLDKFRNTSFGGHSNSFLKPKFKRKLLRQRVARSSSICFHVLGKLTTFPRLPAVRVKVLASGMGETGNVPLPVLATKVVCLL